MSQTGQSFERVGSHWRRSKPIFGTWTLHRAQAFMLYWRES